ncbi:ATPase family AAA domain-containing protein 3B [Termitomyces sp. T112]|nr:ATPase family AAA domain-containing protein 3B [Termitomyces sp. T112]KAH0589934.1 hypothetical protein H2248_000124 [Termitomyces sp. 'cryptogamus']KNZ74720.1 ATPase family AAA domain-containing protein 3B [Termitomyces sp. J132]
MRRFSSLVKASTSSSSSRTEFSVAPPITSEDHKIPAATVPDDEALPVPSLQVKRVDLYFSRWSRSWTYRNMSSKVAVEVISSLQSGNSDPWKDYSFVLVRKIPKMENQEPTFKIVIKSGYILKACQDVVQTWPGISWNAEPVEVDPEMFIAFFDKFIEYRDGLVSKNLKAERDIHMISSVNLLLSSISSDYRTTLSTINRLTSHGEITFELLYALLVPRTLFVATCAITGNTRLFKLVSATRTTIDGMAGYQIQCESYDIVNRSNQTAGIGKVLDTIFLGSFKGATKIQSLDAYPLKYHPDPDKLRAALLKRGKKWVGLNGVHHMQYSGIAAFKRSPRITKHSVDGRIMIDRATFRRMNPDYQFPLEYTVPTMAPVPYIPPQVSADRLPRKRSPPSPDILPSPPISPIIPPMAHTYSPLWNPFDSGTLVQSSIANRDSSDNELTDEDLILTSTVVYGFSLSDKMWFEFDVEEVRPVEWNEDAFANLVLPSDRKDLLRSLVEAHHRELGFDDFIKGKGHGLVINLFGPPGVGKTFSAEATSEHVKRPLYIVGGGDLGTKAANMDTALERIFDVATAWKAIVLIDEADVFLEQRSLHDLERNAMVAVFLRHVEYYRGILFLTTNRVQAFDEAFLSRIHVALHFYELSQTSKEQVWTAFIGKLRVSHSVTQEQIKELATRNINGRQIKNAVRTAQSLAIGRGETIEYRHFVETLDAMDEFTKEFEVVTRK